MKVSVKSRIIYCDGHDELLSEMRKLKSGEYKVVKNNWTDQHEIHVSEESQ